MRLHLLPGLVSLVWMCFINRLDQPLLTENEIYDGLFVFAEAIFVTLDRKMKVFEEDLRAGGIFTHLRAKRRNGM